MIKVAVGQGVTSNTVTNKNLTYEDFKESLISFQQIDEGYCNHKKNNHGKLITLSHEEAISQTLKNAKNKLPWFIAGHFEPQTRKTDNMLFRSLIVLDVDNYNDDINSLEKALSVDLGLYKYLAYSTSSHRPNKPKIRIIIFLTNHIAITEYERITKNFVNNLSFKNAVDEASYKPNQIMFISGILKITNLPKEKKVGEYNPWVKDNNTGKLLNPKDYMYYPTSTNIFSSNSDVSKYDEDNHKCLLELSQEQILSFLERYPAKNTDYYNWLGVGMALHYQYKGSEDGFKIWGQWSSKDQRYKPEEMKPKWNSFDYDHSSPKTFQSIANNINKPSENQEWRQDIEKQINSLSHFSLETDIRKIINILAINCTKNEANIFLYEIKQRTKWLIYDLRNMIKNEQKKLQLKKVKEINPVNSFYPLNTPLPHAIFDGYIDDDKPPKCTYNNFLILLKNYNIKISYNVISKNCDISVPEQKYSKDNEANATFADIINVCKLNSIETSCIESYIFKLGDLNQYNPVLEFIKSKPWDGVSRLSDLYNTVKTKLSFPLEMKELLLRKWLISGIAALKHNKFYSKGVLVFQGEQSLGKTPWFKKLLDPEIEKYFKEGCTLDPSNKDSIKTAISHWIVELGELDSTFKKDIARLKAFITSDEDMFRLPYARKDSKFSRRTIFCGSVNEEEFLIDSTGNHRFWVIPVEKLNYTHNIDMQQLWAEVTTIYENNGQWWLTPEEEQKLEVQNQDHFKSSPLEDLLLEKYDFSKKKELESRTYLKKSATELLQELCYMQITRSLRNEMVQVLKKLGVKRSSHDKKFLIPVSSI